MKFARIKFARFTLSDSLNTCNKSSGAWLYILASAVVQFRNRVKGLGWSRRAVSNFCGIKTLVKKKIKFWYFLLTY